MDENRTVALPDPQKNRKPESRREKRVFTGRIANLQLLLEKDGALFEFALPPTAQYVYVGRETQTDDQKIHIDLSSFNAQNLGVSRTHARFERVGSRLFIRDLNSTNGTWLNGTRLVGMNVNEVFHGDQIEFGRLTSKLYVKSN